LFDEITVLVWIGMLLLADIILEDPSFWFGNAETVIPQDAEPGLGEALNVWIGMLLLADTSLEGPSFWFGNAETVIPQDAEPALGEALTAVV
jgi:hypothetical protein